MLQNSLLGITYEDNPPFVFGPLGLLAPPTHSCPGATPGLSVPSLTYICMRLTLGQTNSRSHLLYTNLFKDQSKTEILMGMTRVYIFTSIVCHRGFPTGFPCPCPLLIYHNPHRCLLTHNRYPHLRPKGVPSPRDDRWQCQQEQRARTKTVKISTSKYPQGWKVGVISIFISKLKITMCPETGTSLRSNKYEQRWSVVYLSSSFDPSDIIRILSQRQWIDFFICIFTDIHDDLLGPFFTV